MTIRCSRRRFAARLRSGVGLSAAVLAEEAATPGATTKENNKAPLMMSFADLKWTELPERKGMLFAVLSGDPTKEKYTQMRKGARRNGQPAPFAQQRAQERHHQWRLVHGGGLRIGQGPRPRVNRNHARQLGARERLPRRAIRETVTVG